MHDWEKFCNSRIADPPPEATDLDIRTVIRKVTLFIRMFTSVHLFT